MENPKKPKRDSKEQLEEQLLLIERLAKRLPWIVLVISLVAFFLILLQVLLSKQGQHPI